MAYRLGKKSLSELRGVHPDVVKVVKRAIEITEQDFSVHDGLRTEREQREYVRRGVSRTMKSKHLKQADGRGHAVDLVPYINGKLRWEWDAIWDIAEAVQQAAKELGVKLRWGGAWRRIDNTNQTPRQMVDDYKAKQRAQGRRAFLDGPHFELAR